MRDSPTRYVRTRDGVDLACRVIGRGPVDLVWSFDQLSDVEIIREYGPIVAFLDQLAGFARVIVHDRRGMGRSGGRRGTLESDVADLEVLLDALGASRPYLAGAVGGGATCAAFAAAHPARVAGLVWHGAFARSTLATDYPWGATAEELEEDVRRTGEGWGTEPFAARFVASAAPSMAGDAEAVRFFARWMRATGSARSAASYVRAWNGIDLHPVLARLRVRTLILVRGGDVDESAYVARLIPGATLVALEGEDFIPFYGPDGITAAIREFVRQG